MSINIAVTVTLLQLRTLYLDDVDQNPTESRKKTIFLILMKGCFIVCSKTILVEPKPYLGTI